MATRQDLEDNNSINSGSTAALHLRRRGNDLLCGAISGFPSGTAGPKQTTPCITCLHPPRPHSLTPALPPLIHSPFSIFLPPTVHLLSHFFLLPPLFILLHTLLFLLLHTVLFFLLLLSVFILVLHPLLLLFFFSPSAPSHLSNTPPPLPSFPHPPLSPHTSSLPLLPFYLPFTIPLHQPPPPDTTLPLSPSPLPSLPPLPAVQVALLALMIHLLSINQFVKLSNYAKGIYKSARSGRRSIISSVTSCQRLSRSGDGLHCQR